MLYPRRSTETLTSSGCKCVYVLPERADLRPALRNRLSITPAVPIDRLGNQQLSPSDQSERGEEGGREGEVGGSSPPLPPLLPFLPPNPLLSCQPRKGFTQLGCIWPGAGLTGGG